MDGKYLFADSSDVSQLNAFKWNMFAMGGAAASLLSRFIQIYIYLSSYFMSVPASFCLEGEISNRDEKYGSSEVLNKKRGRSGRCAV